MKKLYELLETFIENGNIISIKRENVDPHKMITTPLRLSQNFLLVAYWYDFFFNGFKIIRIRDITEIEQNDSEKFLEEIHKKEKIIIKDEHVGTANVADWQQMFKWLSFLNMITIIECERLDDSDFYIGKIMSIESDSIEILQFDGAGIWNQETSVVKYENISCVTFQDRYSELMGKYARDF